MALRVCCTVPHIIKKQLQSTCVSTPPVIHWECCRVWLSSHALHPYLKRQRVLRGGCVAPGIKRLHLEMMAMMVAQATHRQQ